MNKLKIKTPIVLASSIKQDFGNKSIRIVNMCEYFKANIYLSGNGARDYNDEEEFKRKGIKLVYQDFK
jgi:putative NIF3 family GTP cyclohydrolase 1 type 2